MQDLTAYLALSATSLIAIAILAFAGLKGFLAWIALRRSELDVATPNAGFPPSAASRIELADLKERLRKLEAIATGVDL